MSTARTEGDKQWIAYRSRPSAANPFGGLDQAFESESLTDVLAQGRRDRAAGLNPIIEYRVRGATWAPYHPALTVEQLRAHGLARAETVTTVNPRTGTTITRTLWTITDRGAEILAVARTADPLGFDLETEATR